MIYSIGISELMAPHRLPKDHPKDITRAIISACETPNLQDEEYLNFLHEKISKSINSMKPEEISKSVYSLALLNRGYPEIYTNFEARILQSDLEKLRPVNLGIACLGFGLIGMTNFCKAALANVTDCFHRHQGRVYDDYMSEDEENQNKLVLIQEKELDYTIHLTATSIVQMA